MFFPSKVIFPEETGKAAVEIDKQIALKYEGKLTEIKYSR